jgi:hypothetical protein
MQSELLAYYKNINGEENIEKYKINQKQIIDHMRSF